MTLEQTLECFAEGVGQQVGELVKCLVRQEMQSHMQRIEQLQSILNGQTCITTTGLNTNGENSTA